MVRSPGDPLVNLWLSAVILSDAVHFLLDARKATEPLGPDSPQPRTREELAADATESISKIVELVQDGQAKHFAAVAGVDGAAWGFGLAKLARELETWVGISANPEYDRLKVDGEVAPLLAKLDAIASDLQLARGYKPPEAETATDEPTAKESAGKGMPLAEAEVHATRILAAHNKANPKKKMTLALLSEQITYSEGTAHKTAAWQAYQKEWELRHPPKPKAVSMTDAIVAVKGEDDAKLESLIAEQSADFEESPLVSHARKQRRRPKV